MPSPPLVLLKVDKEELEDARWFHASWMAAAVGAANGDSASSSRLAAVVRGISGDEVPFRIPGKHALANRIIHTYLHEWQQRQQWAGEGAEGVAAAAALAAVPDVGIDEGSFKYVLLRLSTPDGELVMVPLTGCCNFRRCCEGAIRLCGLAMRAHSARHNSPSAAAKLILLTPPALPLLSPPI